MRAGVREPKVSISVAQNTLPGYSSGDFRRLSPFLSLKPPLRDTVLETFAVCLHFCRSNRPFGIQFWRLSPFVSISVAQTAPSGYSFGDFRRLSPFLSLKTPSRDTVMETLAVCLHFCLQKHSPLRQIERLRLPFPHAAQKKPRRASAFRAEAQPAANGVEIMTPSAAGRSRQSKRPSSRSAVRCRCRRVHKALRRSRSGRRW